MKTLIHTLSMLMLTFGLLSLSGCNTVKGVGQDFEAMGESMQSAGE